MTQRVPLIAGNWKLNHGGPTSCVLALDVVRALAQGAFPRGSVEVVLAPPFTALAAVSSTLEEEATSLSVPVEVAAQNLYPEDEGAFTGEISAPMLLDAGCKWVIIGHSERRQLFGETDVSVHAKVEAALRAGLRPICCVGETWDERQAGSTSEVIHRQVSAFAASLAAHPGVGVIAYEPVWAIGTGQVAGPAEAQAVHAAIRAQLSEINNDFSNVTRILYGGSVKPDNARGLLACSDIDGALVGGASLKADAFIGIAAALLPARLGS